MCVRVREREQLQSSLAHAGHGLDAREQLHVFAALANHVAHSPNIVARVEPPDRNDVGLQERHKIR